MFGSKIIKMPLGIKLENQYAPSVPDISGSRRKEAKEIVEPCTMPGSGVLTSVQLKST